MVTKFTSSRLGTYVSFVYMYCINKGFVQLNIFLNLKSVKNYTECTH